MNKLITCKVLSTYWVKWDYPKDETLSIALTLEVGHKSPLYIPVYPPYGSDFIDLLIKWGMSQPVLFTKMGELIGKEIVVFPEKFGNNWVHWVNPSMKQDEELSYPDLLRKPQWQKVRLKQLQIANWACQICGDTNNELHVHHKYYDKNKKPWEYPDSCFIVLCSTCHEIQHRNKHQ